MSRLLGGASLSAVLLLSALPSRAAESELLTTLAPTEITVGDHTELVVELRLPADVSPRAVTWPSWEPRFGDAEIVAQSRVESGRESARQVLRQRLTLTLFRTGSFILPAVEVGIARGDRTDTLTSTPGRLEVVSVLPPGEDLAEAKPPAPPHRLELGARFWWLTASLLALCLAGIAWLVRLSPSEALGSDAPRLAPLEELSRSLEALRGENDPVALHAGASMALRRYLGRRLGFTGPESTTTEVDRALRRRRLDSDLLRQAVELLTTCDMVKFARRTVEEEAARRRLDQVESLADRIEQWLKPPEPAEGSEAEPPIAEAS